MQSSSYVLHDPTSITLQQQIANLPAPSSHQAATASKAHRMPGSMANNRVVGEQRQQRGGANASPPPFVSSYGQSALAEEAEQDPVVTELLCLREKYEAAC